MHWRQIYLVLKREYLTRVRTKIFIISTLLIPLGFIGYLALVIGIQYWESEPEQNIGILDQTEVISPRLLNLNEERYIDMGSITVDSVRSLVMEGELDGYIYLTEEHILGEVTPEFIYKGSGSITLLNSIRTDLREVIREERLAREQVSEDVRNIFEARISLESRKLTDAGTEEEDKTAFYTGLGFIMGMVIFFALFMYGTIIMRGVIEEKANRIVEVIASSIRPIELLTGKILGITGVALTQFVIWFVLIGLVAIAAGPLMLMFMDDAAMDPAALNGTMDAMGGIDPSTFEIPAIDPILIVFFFIYFILGYFIYSALFAVVGSAVDSESDTQQLMLPIISLIFVAFFLNVEVMQNPESTISVISSLFPFFTPINMMTRMAISSVPVWQLALSLILMVATIYATMWLCARIYRVGILQYGDKAGFKDLLKWIRQG